MRCLSMSDQPGTLAVWVLRTRETERDEQRAVIARQCAELAAMFARTPVAARDARPLVFERK